MGFFDKLKALLNWERGQDVELSKTVSVDDSKHYWELVKHLRIIQPIQYNSRLQHHKNKSQRSNWKRWKGRK